MRDQKPAPPRYPQPVRMQPGETRHWCRCGHSDTAPFCTDGHCPAPDRLAYTTAKEEIVLFCGCGATSRPPHCDGAHQGLRGKKRGREGKTDNGKAAWWRRWWGGA